MTCSTQPRLIPWPCPGAHSDALGNRCVRSAEVQGPGYHSHHKHLGKLKSRCQRLKHCRIVNTLEGTNNSNFKVKYQLPAILFRLCEICFTSTVTLLCALLTGEGYAGDITAYWGVCPMAQWWAFIPLMEHKIPNLPPAGGLHTPTGSSNSDCLTMCLRSSLLLTLSYVLFHINHLQEFQHGSQERKLTVSKTEPQLCSLFHLPSSKNSSSPHEAVSERSFICTCNLAQNHTLSCWLFLIAVYLDSFEEDDKIGMRAQAVLGSLLLKEGEADILR